VGSYTVVGANGVASAKAKAAALLAEIQSEGQQISSLGQQYDNERTQAQKLHNHGVVLLRSVKRDQRAVTKYQASLQAAAVNAYVNSGSVNSTNPLFATNENTLGASSIYNQVAEGNLAGSVANFTNARQALSSDLKVLHAADVAHAAAESQLRNELQRGNALEANLHSQLTAANAAVRQQLALQQQAASVASFSDRVHVQGQNFPAPPPNSRANIAVDTALSYLGVPYVWGGASRSGVDCSGLTMLSWEAAGVDLPHFSGAQMADSTPVPINDLQPGDLLFYGPGGSDHVAMWLGNGKMIQAPYTGAYVSIAPADFSSWFAGAGRP
jgi:peptidoglycan DL-endopeptidase CwlO